VYEVVWAVKGGKTTVYFEYCKIVRGQDACQIELR
jgi:hypothetical protein